jgi:Na+/H+ antiporter NhaA
VPRSNILPVLMFFGGLFFTTIAVVMWQRGRRVAALVFAIVAGIDIAMALDLVRRISRT